MLAFPDAAHGTAFPTTTLRATTQSLDVRDCLQIAKERVMSVRKSSESADSDIYTAMPSEAADQADYQ